VTPPLVPAQLVAPPPRSLEVRSVPTTSLAVLYSTFQDDSDSEVLKSNLNTPQLPSDGDGPRSLS
jgi:hypothetical protein